METIYFGVVAMISIENVWPANHQNIEPANNDAIMTESHIKLVHYPDCQQLIIWLPADGDSYQDIALWETNTSMQIWRKEIRLVINGTIKIILDTLPFKPGDLAIKITKKDGIQHIINLKKYPEGIYPEETKTKPEIVLEEDRATTIYRDGFGNVIPDQDLIMRGVVLDEMYRKFNRRLKYEGAGRSNTVIYIDGDKSTKFYSEMGGGNCLFYLYIPNTENWERETGFSVKERDEIIQFVAENTLRDQTSSSGAYFEIEDRWITFYKASV